MNRSEHLNMPLPEYVDPADILRITEAIDILDQNAERTDAALANKASGITLTENRTIYVTKNGNDMTANGTELKPFSTIQAAVDFAGRLFGNYAKIIRIKAGTYAESITAVGIPFLWAVGDSGIASDVIITPGANEIGLQIIACPGIVLNDFSINSPSGTGEAVTMRSSLFYVRNLQISAAQASSKIGIHCYYGSSGYVSTCVFSSLNTAIAIQSGGQITAAGNTGTGNNIVFSSNGAVITRSGTTPTGTTLESKTNGGQIFS